MSIQNEYDKLDLCVEVEHEEMEPQITCQLLCGLLPTLQADTNEIDLLPIHCKTGHMASGVYTVNAQLVPTQTVIKQTHTEDPAFDIVITVAPQDLPLLKQQIYFTKTNILGYRHIYIISRDLEPDSLPSGCTYIDERFFPFSITSVATIHGESSRNGWYLQQLLKLYAGFVITGILDKYLTVDVDTCFLKPTRFIIDNTVMLTSALKGNHQPYFDHMLRLHPSLSQADDYSGISHHMMFETKYVKELMMMVEAYHKGEVFWKVFLEQVSADQVLLSGASEFELYFHYMLQYRSHTVKVRELRLLTTGMTTLYSLDNFKGGSQWDFVSFQKYVRNSVAMNIKSVTPQKDLQGDKIEVELVGSKDQLHLLITSDCQLTEFCFYVTSDRATYLGICESFCAIIPPDTTVADINDTTGLLNDTAIASLHVSKILSLSSLGLQCEPSTLQQHLYVGLNSADKKRTLGISAERLLTHC